MYLLSSIARIAAELAAARTRLQTEQTIRSLPFEIQKDIGWPGACMEPACRNRPLK